ncbi:hypothetical protein [Burkholderia vietnamiensis]|uniref:hypothetical protein n=1 Tax=Burkholderia vietnamiensis TaxID=60552 RepID=UPI00075EBA8D|nr:hypothetical protein [Burkholderia vietnamiensis]KVR93952.1 hypothetical protein WK27_29905 [Burkholderia vietnamiensis]
MNEINGGGPAFPEVPGDCNGYEGQPGMKLRDYFAAKAMQGICANPDIAGWDFDAVVFRAYGIADAMLRARGV